MERKKRSRASGETLTVPWFVYVPKEIVMPRNPFARPLLLAAFLILVSLRVSAAVPESQTAKVSTFGQYSGYSEAVYDGWVRSSLRDGAGWDAAGGGRLPAVA